MNITTNLYNALNISNKLQKIKNTSFGVTCPNLAPLSKDTVSFSGRASLSGSSMVFAPSLGNCHKVSNNAMPAQYYLDSLLKKYLKSVIDDDRKIVNYSVRTKRANSIKEKVVSKYDKIHKQQSEMFAKQVLSELKNHYQVNNNISDDKLLEQIIRSIDYINYSQKIMPYQNPDIVLEQVISNFKRDDSFSFNSNSDKANEKIYNEILSKLEEKANELPKDFRFPPDPTTIKGIKSYARDIVGARIVLEHSSDESAAFDVLNGLMQAAKDGKLKITTIENHIPSKDKLPEGKTLLDYAYTSKSQLAALQKASGAKLINNESKTGYMAIHINVEFDDEEFNRYRGIYGGYGGEIQIIGHDVKILKDIEDLCYKIKDNKAVAGEAYQEFKDYFTKYYNDSNKKDFDDYTYSLYLHQREITKNADKNNSFPTIEELGFADKLPKELDFNNLKKIKNKCDKKQEILDKEQFEQLQKKDKTSQSNKIFTQGNIRTMMCVLQNKLNS